MYKEWKIQVEGAKREVQERTLVSKDWRITVEAVAIRKTYELIGQV